MPVDAVATQAFKANPLGFLAQNLILAPTQNALSHNKSEHLALENEQTKDGQGGWTATIAGNPGGLFRVVKAGDSVDYFRSYIADYAQGVTTFTTLGTNRNTLFCFTINMNGCTFGMGSQAGGAGSLVVSHGNAANTGLHDQNIPDVFRSPESRKALQDAIQYTNAKAGHGVGGQVFEPRHYRVGQFHSTTFMYRQPGQRWDLYCMRYTRGGGGAYSTPGVELAPTRQIT